MPQEPRVGLLTTHGEQPKLTIPLLNSSSQQRRASSKARRATIAARTWGGHVHARAGAAVADGEDDWGSPLRWPPMQHGKRGWAAGAAGRGRGGAWGSSGRGVWWLASANEKACDERRSGWRARVSCPQLEKSRGSKGGSLAFGLAPAPKPIYAPPGGRPRSHWRGCGPK